MTTPPKVRHCHKHVWTGTGICPHCAREHIVTIPTPCHGSGVALTTDQPAPVANALPAAWDLVMADMRERDRFGKDKYGVRLQPNNGRDFLADAYQEALDLAVYLRGAIYERDNK